MGCMFFFKVYTQTKRVFFNYNISLSINVLGYVSG
ncbi:hypothetical protein O9A_01234 [Bartonella koehlerae C-29]|uniref:Uncharacterized protein n=1 Tax=Bartonella koehlerae C-29 TaxID=1134510 RepID=A0A067W410_9HYPH|nr:hypothetical protein O9A_01234 [Bartonella koehlerae C-29]